MLWVSRPARRVADKVEMGVFSSVMTRIQSSESVGNRKSSFGSDLEQIHSMMRNASADALLLVDEFGSFHFVGWLCAPPSKKRRGRHISLARSLARSRNDVCLYHRMVGWPFRVCAVRKRNQRS